MPLTSSTADVLAVAGTALGLVGTTVALVASSRLARVRDTLAKIRGAHGDTDLIDALARSGADTDALLARLGGVQAELAELRSDISQAVRHVAVVRYDAFGDMGGRLSFSAALLDDAANGLVLTSINGRTETRTYLKGVRGGQSDTTLSPEEDQAVTYAVRGHTPVVPADARGGDHRRDGGSDRRTRTRPGR